MNIEMGNGRKSNLTPEGPQRYLGIMEESFQHKLDIIVDGVQMLAEKVDKLEVRMDGLETKVEGVAVDLTAHRADTEAHLGMYRVKEGLRVEEELWSARPVK